MVFSINSRLISFLYLWLWLIQCFSYHRHKNHNNHLIIVITIMIIIIHQGLEKIKWGKLRWSLAIWIGWENCLLSSFLLQMKIMMILNQSKLKTLLVDQKNVWTWQKEALESSLDICVLGMQFWWCNRIEIDLAVTSKWKLLFDFSHWWPKMGRFGP